GNYLLKEPCWRRQSSVREKVRMLANRPSASLPISGPGQSGGDFTQRGFGPRFDLFPGLVLDRVRDINRVEVGPPERARLRPGGGHKFGRRHRDRRDPQVFQLRRVVQTARRAGASIGQRFDHGVAPRGDESVKHFGGRGFGECRLGLAHYFRNTRALLQQPRQAVEKEIAAGLADVEQADGFARQLVQSRCGTARLAPGFVELVDEYGGHVCSPMMNVYSEVKVFSPRRGQSWGNQRTPSCSSASGR